MNRKSLACCFGALALAGCPGPSDGGAITLEDLPAQFAAAQCDAIARCGGDLDQYEQFLLHEQITDCDAQLTGFLDAFAIAPLRAGIEDGTIVYHPELARACVDGYASASCGGFGLASPPSACVEVFEGTLADGEPCSNGEQCSNTSTCDNSRSGMCPSGVCVHVPQRGEACTSSCGFNLRCYEGTCGDLAGQGEACDLTGGLQCEGDLSCQADETDPEMAHCVSRPPAGEGEPCSVAGCETGLVCGATGTCRQAHTDGTCEAVITGPDECDDGETCVVEEGATTGTCGALPSTGEPCTSTCARGARCTGSVGFPGVCVTPVANGSPCETSTECTSFYCDEGTCSEPPLCRE